MSTTAIVVQARAGGSRFPGKMLAPLLGQPLILWTLQRLAAVYGPGAIIVALPPGDAHAPLGAVCERHGYAVLQPAVPETDVLARYQAIAEEEGLDTIVRVTGDCPLIDPQVVRGCLRAFETGHYDHLGIAAEWPDGMDCEAFSRLALDVADAEATDAADREHVTPYLWRQPQRFVCGTYPCPMDLTAYQWSVDTPGDLRLVEDLLKRVLRQAGVGFGWRDLWLALEESPGLKSRMLSRPPRNQAYVTQTGAASWETARYGGEA